MCVSSKVPYQGAERSYVLGKITIPTGKSPERIWNACLGMGPSRHINSARVDSWGSNAFPIFVIQGNSWFSSVDICCETIAKIPLASAQPPVDHLSISFDSWGTN